MIEYLTLDNLWTLLKILAIPTALRAYIWAQGLRSYGVWLLYKNRDAIFRHKLYVELDALYTSEELFNTIADPGRREIFKDVFKIEVYSLNDIVLELRKEIYGNFGFIEFMKINRYLGAHELIEKFLRMYKVHRDKMKRGIFKELKRNGLSKPQINYIVQKYYEFTAQNSYILKERLEIKKHRGNLYYSIIDILEMIEVEVMSQKVFLPLKFAALNGKLDNIKYKNISTMTESGIKVVYDGIESSE